MTLPPAANPKPTFETVKITLPSGVSTGSPMIVFTSIISFKFSIAVFINALPLYMPWKALGITAGGFLLLFFLLSQFTILFVRSNTIILVLMLTSKGAAGVTGSGFIVLASTLSALQVIPLEGLALLLGVDRFMSEGRAIVNLIGNGIATIIVAKSENEFDEVKSTQAVKEMKTAV